MAIHRTKVISWASLCIIKAILISHCHFLIRSSFFWLQCDITAWLLAMGHKLESCHLRLLFMLSHINTSSYLLYLPSILSVFKFPDRSTCKQCTVITVRSHPLSSVHIPVLLTLCPFPIFLPSCLVKMVRAAVCSWSRWSWQNNG